MARTFQQPTVAGSLTVAENMLLAAAFGGPERRPGAAGRAGEVGRRATGVRRAGGQGGARVRTCSGVFDKKRLMLGTALATGARALLLDEPFGGLSPAEIDGRSS